MRFLYEKGKADLTNTWGFRFVIFFKKLTCKFFSSLFLGECRSALGMEAGRIPDSAISASSSYEAKSVGPQNAR